MLAPTRHDTKRHDTNEDRGGNADTHRLGHVSRLSVPGRRGMHRWETHRQVPAKHVVHDSTATERRRLQDVLDAVLRECGPAVALRLR